MHLPPQNVVLAVTYNKMQLVDIIVETLVEQKQQLVEISHVMTIRREDLRNAHEEVNVIILHQMLSIVESSTNAINISVISDDTDVFVQLVHLYHTRQLTCHVTMEATYIGIQATAHSMWILLVNY